MFILPDEKQASFQNTSGPDRPQSYEGFPKSRLESLTHVYFCSQTTVQVKVLFLFRNHPSRNFTNPNLGTPVPRNRSDNKPTRNINININK